MKDNFKEIFTEELKRKINDHATVIIDARPVEAYNGWRLKGEPRGGHIKGARSLPAKWLKYIDWIEAVRSKDIRPEQHLIVYGYDEKDPMAVAKRLQDSGYHNVGVYLHFMDEWSPDLYLPIEQMSGYRHLVYPEWVKELTEGGNPPEFGGGDFVICHAHYQNPGDYKKGHIPGAISLDTNILESSDTWNRRTPEELKGSLEKLGITTDTTVILYGRFSFPRNEDPFPGSSAGQIGAIRSAFIMMYAGVKDVRVLNGALQSWIDAGFELSTTDEFPSPVNDFGAGIPVRPELAVDIAEAKQMLASEDAELVCVRSLPEYLGEVSGYHYIEKAGRIPGAIFGHCGSDAYHMENYRNFDHTTREYHEIEAMWQEAGILPSKHNAFYCGTGWRGSEAWFNAFLMGWPRASVFDGGWFEWSSDPENPVE